MSTQEQVPNEFPAMPPEGGLAVSVVFARLQKGSAVVHVKKATYIIAAGGGPELERLRLLEAGVLLVNKCAIELENKGWKADVQADPTSGEGSPL